MGFDKEYPNRKDWRKQYHGGKKYFGSCRSHGGCPWCEGKITHKKLKVIPADEAEQISAVAMTVIDYPCRRYMHDKLLHRGDVRWEAQAQ